jgi:hypothetical protein
MSRILFIEVFLRGVKLDYLATLRCIRQICVNYDYPMAARIHQLNGVARMAPAASAKP